MRTLLIGIDGAGGSGKSTLAATLGDKIVSTDDFIAAPRGWYDFELDVRLRDAYDHRIWVETRREICFARGLERDGAEALPLWKAWSEKEHRYWSEQRPREAADEIVDGSGS